MKLVKAIENLRPGSKWILHGSLFENIEWIDDTTQPTLEEIGNEIIRINVEEAANEYRDNRKVEYPSIGDQLDALFHAGVFPPEMAAQIQAIKDKYPKP